MIAPIIAHAAAGVGPELRLVLAAVQSASYISAKRQSANGGTKSLR